MQSLPAQMERLKLRRFLPWSTTITGTYRGEVVTLIRTCLFTLVRVDVLISTARVAARNKFRTLSTRRQDGLKGVRMIIYVPGHYFQFRNMDHARS